MTNSDKSLSERFREYRPSKTALAWSSVGMTVVVLAVGFTVGGWMTAGSARVMANTAAQEARAELAASICAHNVQQSANFEKTMSALEDAESWAKDDVITEGGWVTMAGGDSPVLGAADICAEQLADAGTSNSRS
ncbi:hypothetical protein [Thalassobaculum litoreum]|uniref:Uncharacterized protein n=1 Tax=Thalassobaculum litoreum DSM 18839 TaxID=1123362 RepID=A0A8G2BM94_9PROT|nr:hypothetical protein [Thalassobaculum litoreum]SDG34245.1 hypothetical protein SAMN05660686_04082 [Thalassobaculum litoreum DSM 18839]